MSLIHLGLASRVVTATAAPQPDTNRARPRLCIVGPLIGRNPGYVPQQGEALSTHFRAAGLQVVAVSAAVNPYTRLIDTLTRLVSTRNRVDTVLLQVYGGRSFVVEDLASALAGLFQHRIVMHLHGGAMPEFMARFPRWTRRVLGRAHAIVTPSEFLARAVQGWGWVAHVIPNVIDISDYDFRPRERVAPRLFWMRSFHPLYNPSMALRVLARVQADLPGATLVMAGRDKGLEPEVRRDASRLHLEGTIRFVGFLDPAAKRREADAADIFINTSRVDNMPIAIVEACAAGLPVVSTAVGGIPDLLSDGETGLLTPDDDADAMAAAVLRLVADSSLAARLSRNGRRVAERCAWALVRPQWQRLFAELPPARPGGSQARENG